MGTTAGRRQARRRATTVAAAAGALLLLMAATLAQAQPSSSIIGAPPLPPDPPSAFGGQNAPPTVMAAPSTDPIIVAPPEQPTLPPIESTTTPADAPPAVVPPTPAQEAAEADLLTLANTLGSHMVLQQAPLPACLYGTGAPLALVEVAIVEGASSSTQTVVDLMGNWVACLPPQKAGGPHTMTVTGSGGKRTLEDVWFGEVWLCAGQSNMQMSLRQVLNASAELQASASMDATAPIRVLALGLNSSAEPLADVSEALLPWSVASHETLGGPVWKYFSGACWFYGRHLAEGLGVPVGLVQAAYGSTELRAWSPPDVLAACPPTPDAWAAPPQEEEQEEQEEEAPEPPPDVAAGPGAVTPPVAPPVPPATDPPLPPTDGPEASSPAAAPADPAAPLISPAAPPPAAAAAAATDPAKPAAANNNNNNNGRLRRGLAPAAAVDSPVVPAAVEPGEPLRPWQTEWHPEPSTTFNALVHPLRLMGLRGVVWDQGEQDVHHADDDYRCLLPEFIQAWRRAFPYANALGPMPFGIFQLQGYSDAYMDIVDNGTEVGRIRLAQASALGLPKVFLAVGYDLNDDASPYGPVHFRDKQDVGRRLAQAALANVYGEWGSLPWGPSAKEVLSTWGADPLDADTLVLTVRVGFVGVGEGLVDSGVNIFELATDADATDYDYQVLEATNLALAGPEQAVVAFHVPKTHALAQADARPVLRYAYKNNPCPARADETPYVGAWCGLYSSEEQPALPFVRPL